MSEPLDAQGAAAVLERCKSGEDEDSCGNIDGCGWYASRNACGPKCEMLGAGPCKDPAFGCGWTSDSKCALAGSPGTEDGEGGRGCPAYTSPSSCNAGTGCAWDTGDNACHKACEDQPTKTACGESKGVDGAQRCLWANGKCARRVVAQCSPLWQDNTGPVGVAVGQGMPKMDAGQYILIGIVVIAMVIVLVVIILEYKASMGGAMLAQRPPGAL